MCGFDSCYPCFMLLNIFETRLRKNKNRRRGFVYKKACPINKRRRKFRKIKRKITRRNIPRPFKIRLAFRKMYKFRRFLRKFKRTHWKRNLKFRKLLSTTEYPRQNEEDVIFTYWVNEPNTQLMVYGKVWTFLKKIILINNPAYFSLKNSSPLFCDPFVVFWRSSNTKFQTLMEVYKPFYYNMVNYSTFNSFNNHYSFTRTNQVSLVKSTKSPTTVLKMNNKLINSPRNIRTKRVVKILKLVKDIKRAAKRLKKNHKKKLRVKSKPRKISRQRTRRLQKKETLFYPTSANYLMKVDFQIALNKRLIQAGRVQIASYFLSFHHFITNYTLRITESGAIYKTNGFKSRLNKLRRSIRGLNKTWLLTTADNYFETLVDYNYNQQPLNQRQRRRRSSRKSYRKAPRFQWRLKLSPAISARQLTFINRKKKFHNQINHQTLVESNHPQTASFGFQNIHLQNKLMYNINLTQLILTNKVLYKYLAFNHNDSSTWTLSRTNYLALKSISADLSQTHFNSRVTAYSCSNILPSQFFKYSIKRKLFKLFKFHKFSVNVVMWYYNMLVRFIENCSGKKVYLKFNPFIENSLTFTDIARCNLWAVRVMSFQRILGPKIFVQESLRIFHLALRSKDPTFLSNWIKGMLQRMSFWKYRLLFRYLKFVMRYLFWTHFADLGFKGLKLRLKGKISVAGNARTRTLLYRIGETSYSTFNNKVVSDFSTINTFTGVLGFRVWFFF